MDWRKRKKRRRIVQHYGFSGWESYQHYLRLCCTVERVRSPKWILADRKLMVTLCKLRTRMSNPDAIEVEFVIDPDFGGDMKC